MPKLNERLSHWDALHSCYCGFWTYRQARSEYEHMDGKRVRTVAKDGACEVCGYDLSRSPLENIDALTAKDFSGSLIKGSCFSSEAGWELPADITDCEFTDCNLDNVTVPVGVKITGGSHRLIAVQNDRTPWICDWKTGLPVAPVNHKERAMAGLSVDPKTLPVVALTDEEIKAAEQQKAIAVDLADAQAKVVELSAKLAATTDPEAVK